MNPNDFSLKWPFQKFVALLLFLHVSNGIKAQQVVFERITVQEGLSSNKVFTTVEDNDGFIWIAHDNGVDRFDGATIVSYDLPDRVNHRGTFVEIFLALDSKGALWALYNDGDLFLYSPSKDEFIHSKRILPKDGSNIYVNTFFIDSNDRFIIGAVEGAFIIEPETGTGQPLHSVQGSVSSIVQSKRGVYYIGSSKGVYVYDRLLNYQYNLADTVEGGWPLANQNIESLFIQDMENRLWVGSGFSGLYSIYLDSVRLEKVLGDLSRLKVPIRSIQNFSKGSLLVGTDGAGVFQYDPYQDKLTGKFTHDEDNPSSLSSNAVYDIFLNDQGVFFISTYRGGINILKPQQPGFNLVRHARGIKRSLGNDLVYSIFEPSPGVISFGTDRGISQWDRTSDSWSHLEIGSIDSRESALVLSQAADADGDLWITSFTHSLKVLRGKEDFAIDGFPKNLRTKIIYRHPDNTMLVGAVKYGTLHLKDEKVINKYDISNPVDIEFYSKEKVLIANHGGVAVVNLVSQEVSHLENEPYGEVLKGKAVTSLLLDNHGKTWVGTYSHGLLVIDMNAGTHEVINKSVGLGANNIYDILSDKDGLIWVATSSGISRIMDAEITNFFKVPSTDFNRNAGCVDSEGICYFGTNVGAIYFDPRDIKAVEVEKKIVFNHFYLNHQKIETANPSVLDSPINKQSEIKLAHDQNSFSIEFTAIDFIQANENRYMWMLDGFDRDWVKGNANSQANYTNLSPGSYYFKVKAINPIGQSLSEERKLSIVIDAPFWEKWWFYLLYVIVGVGVVLFLIYSNNLRLESKNAEERLHFLIEMAHEIKTPLTLIKTPLADLLKNKETDSETKEILQVALSSADKLHKQMMQFLDFRNVNVRKARLQTEWINVPSFVKDKIFAFKVLAEKKHIKLHMDPHKSFTIQGDLKILDKVISNLLSNAIKYTPENGSVTLRLKKTDKKWSLSVRDTGIGISKADQKKVFTLFYRTDEARSSGETGSGVGLVLASDLAKTMKGAISLRESSPKGSEFVFTMPLSIPSEDEANAKIKKSEEEETSIIENEILGDEQAKILLVEDNDDLRNYQHDKLKKYFKVITATNGQEALKKMQEMPPDMVITDIMMPKMNGRQLCMNIKTDLETSHIPVILLTGLESSESIKQGLESGADDYIVKPYEFDLLIAKINNLFNTRNAFKNRFINAQDEDAGNTRFANQLDEKFIEEVQQLIKKNINDPDLSVSYLCQLMGMSRTAFYHKLKSLTGMSPADFIRTLRLKKARRLLLNPNYNISEVAYSTGFSDAKYFSTLFKKYYNLTPSEFIASQEKIQPY